jgi:hypothetical protein
VALPVAQTGQPCYKRGMNDAEGFPPYNPDLDRQAIDQAIAERDRLKAELDNAIMHALFWLIMFLGAVYAMYRIAQW